MKNFRKVLFLALPAFLAGTALGYFVLAQHHDTAKTGKNNLRILTPCRGGKSAPIAPSPTPWDNSTPLAKALSAPTAPARAQAVDVLVAQTSASKLSDLLNQAVSAPRVDDRDYVRQRAYAKWVASDSAKAVDHARAGEQLEGELSLLRYVYSAKGEIDPCRPGQRTTIGHHRTPHSQHQPGDDRLGQERPRGGNRDGANLVTGGFSGKQYLPLVQCLGP